MRNDNIVTIPDSKTVSRIIQENKDTGIKSLRQKTKVKTPSRRLIVYIIGGVCYSEIRSIHEIMDHNSEVEIFIGGTHITTPREFIQDLANLSIDPKKMGKKSSLFKFPH
jgi:hypothetical protein